MKDKSSVTVVEAWLRERAFRALFVLFLFAALFSLWPEYYENARLWFIAVFFFIVAVVSYGTLRLLCRRWPDFLQFPWKAPLLKAGLFFIVFWPLCFVLLGLLFGWLGWLDEQSWAKPPPATQVGMHAWFVGMWYGFWWAPLPALLGSWFLCRG